MEKSEFRTIFVLDHTKILASKTQDIINFDSIKKLSLNTDESFTNYKKSIWTLVTEGIIEYCRIIYDLFPSSHQVSIITVDKVESVLTAWYEEDQSLQAVWNVLSEENVPVDSNIENLLSYCNCPGLDSIVYLFKMLHKLPDFFAQSRKYKVVFIGVDIHEKIDLWKNSILKEFIDLKFDLEDKIDWSFVCIHSEDDKNRDSFHSEINSKDPVKFENNCVLNENQGIYRGLMRLCEQHMQLSSTLVQDIPMKEEANSKSSSSMYGVELIHTKEVHESLKKLGLLDALYIRNESSNDNQSNHYHIPDSGFSKSVGIKWVTPKATDAQLYRFTTGSFRITLAEVGNRASTCLAQFVLGGRSVVLAHGLDSTTVANLMAARKGVPYVSLNRRETSSRQLCALDKDGMCCSTLNMEQMEAANFNTEVLLLTSHGSIMYIHVLANLFPLSYIPLIPLVPSPIRASNLKPENLRLKEFTKKMLSTSRLAPAAANIEYTELPQKRAFRSIDRITKYLPLITSETMLDNITTLEPLFENLPKEFLEPEEVQESMSSIRSFINIVKTNQILIDFFKQTERLHKKSLAYVYQMRKILSSTIILQVIELNHLICEYGSLSDEHGEIKQFWSKAIKSEALDVGNRFKIKDFIDSALKLLSNHFHNVKSSKGEPESINNLLDLRLVCHQLGKRASSENITSAVGTSPILVKNAGVSPTIEGFDNLFSDNEAQIFNFARVGREEFIHSLLMNQSRETGNRKNFKKEFEGAISTNNYHLYSNLKLVTTSEIN